MSEKKWKDLLNYNPRKDIQYQQAVKAVLDRSEKIGIILTAMRARPQIFHGNCENCGRDFICRPPYGEDMTEFIFKCKEHSYAYWISQGRQVK